jgi:uncharacterized protein (DUF983 family)
MVAAAAPSSFNFVAVAAPVVPSVLSFCSKFEIAPELSSLVWMTMSTVLSLAPMG